MKFIERFNTFMRNTVNINQSRLDNLAGAVDAIYQALKADGTIGPLLIGKEPQGSWKHQTIIKPVNGNEFDADFMLIMKEVAEWSEQPGRYIDEVHAALSRHGTYKAMVRPPKCRCVRVVYANDFHVDIVPFLVLDGGRQVIVNRDEDSWEDTDPGGFSAWMRKKDGVAGGHLRRVIRLVKYLRDHDGNFRRTRSVILTALLGEMVDSSKKLYDASYYGDLPTALYHIVNDLDAWLQLRITKPSIADPSGASDPAGFPVTFDHRWKEADYENFRAKIHDLADAIAVAYENDDPDASLVQWCTVFGEEFKQTSQSVGWLTGSDAAPAVAVPSVQSGRAG